MTGPARATLPQQKRGIPAAAFEAAQPGVKVRLTYRPSGLLKNRIAGGEPSNVFTSANMTHPEALAAAGRAGRVQRFVRNAMFALVRPGLDAPPWYGKRCLGITAHGLRHEALIEEYIAITGQEPPLRGGGEGRTREQEGRRGRRGWP